MVCRRSLSLGCRPGVRVDGFLRFSVSTQPLAGCPDGARVSAACCWPVLGGSEAASGSIPLRPVLLRTPHVLCAVAGGGCCWIDDGYCCAGGQPPAGWSAALCVAAAPASSSSPGLVAIHQSRLGCYLSQLQACDCMSSVLATDFSLVFVCWANQRCSVQRCAPLDLNVATCCGLGGRDTCCGRC